MAAYSSGSARITAGSSTVFGNGTQWDVFLAAGDLFKITGDSIFYEISSVVSASELTLTTRYANINFQNAVASNVASVTTATKMYSGTLGRTPVIQNSIRFVASTAEAFTDNGAGVLAGNASPAGSGTIDYDSGAWAITFGTSLTATLNLAASFNQGTLNQGLNYQAVVDFTPFFNIPEMSTNDVNFAHIYTKAMRIIDKQIAIASMNNTASVMTASHFHGTKSATMNNMSIVNASITNASIQKLKATNASINNASINTLKVQNFIGSVTTLDNIAVLNSATIVEASIQKLKVINASIRNASINTLMVQKIKGTNASFVEASIQKAKILNASVNNASANILKVQTFTVVNAMTRLPGVNATLTQASIQNLKVQNNFKAVNASITNASVQNLKVLNSVAFFKATNASLTNASIQNLKVLNPVTFFKAVNASLTNASIQNLKVLNTVSAVNASITSATIQLLTVHASRLKVDQTWDGYSLNATMAATVAFGEVLYTDSSFDYRLANCATSGTLPVSAMAVSAGPGKQKIILRGQICATAWSWSPGLIYCAATDGALTQLIADGSGKIVQIMGHAISANTMFFNPNKGTVKIA